MKKYLGFLLIFTIVSSLKAEQEELKLERTSVPSVPMQKRIQNVPMSRTPSWHGNLTTMWERDQFKTTMGAGLFGIGVYFFRKHQDMYEGLVMVAGVYLFANAYLRARDHNQIANGSNVQNVDNSNSNNTNSEAK